MKHLFLSTTIFAIASSGAVAQTVETFPPRYATSWGDTSLGTGTGLGTNTDSRAQHILAAPWPIGTVILGVGFRQEGGDDASAAFMADMEIRMSSTPVVPGTSSSTFSANIGTDETVVLPQAMYPTQAFDVNRGTGEFAMFPLTTPFVLGTNGEANLCVDVFVFSTTNGSSSDRFRPDRCLNSSANGTALTNGIGCGTADIGTSTTGGTYILGSTFDIELTGAEPLMPAFLFTSFNMRDSFGVPLPFDFNAILGAGPGCDLLVDPAIIIPLNTDVAGNITVGGVPSPSSNQIAYVGFQWMYLVTPTAMNVSGIELTGQRQINFGPRTCAYEYVWDLSNVNATTGSVNLGGAIMQFEVVLP